MTKITYLGPNEILTHRSNPSGTEYVFERNVTVDIAKEDADHYAKKAAFKVEGKFAKKKSSKNKGGK